MKVRISIEGTAPLLVHNIQLADPLDPYAREMKKISGKRKKTDEDHEKLAELEFQGGLYFDDAIGPYLPGANIEKCFVEGARVTRQGKQVERGLMVLDNEIPLIYAGPRTREALWADQNHRSRLSVRVGTARVQRTRPMFRDWKLDVDATLNPELLDLDVFQAILDDAGSMSGLGDYRPRYGRFNASVEAL